ncbi:cat eye syndrome chromosome region, candidate 2, partial [Quaeritorhiza haematococci]
MPKLLAPPVISDGVKNLWPDPPDDPNGEGFHVAEIGPLVHWKQRLGDIVVEYERMQLLKKSWEEMDVFKSRDARVGVIHTASREYQLKELPPGYRLHVQLFKPRARKGGKPVLSASRAFRPGFKLKEGWRTDPYLYGHPAATTEGGNGRFRSVPEFIPHFVWLLRVNDGETNDHGDCTCGPCRLFLKNMRKLYEDITRPRVRGIADDSMPLALFREKELVWVPVVVSGGGILRDGSDLARAQRSTQRVNEGADAVDKDGSGIPDSPPPSDQHFIYWPAEIVSRQLHDDPNEAEMGGISVSGKKGNVLLLGAPPGVASPSSSSASAASQTRPTNTTRNSQQSPAEPAWRLSFSVRLLRDWSAQYDVDQDVIIPYVGRTTAHIDQDRAFLRSRYPDTLRTLNSALDDAEAAASTYCPFARYQHKESEARLNQMAPEDREYLLSMCARPHYHGVFFGTEVIWTGDMVRTKRNDRVGIEGEQEVLLVDTIYEDRESGQLELSGNLYIISNKFVVTLDAALEEAKQSQTRRSQWIETDTVMPAFFPQQNTKTKTSVIRLESVAGRYYPTRSASVVTETAKAATYWQQYPGADPVTGEIERELNVRDRRVGSVAVFLGRLSNDGSNPIDDRDVVDRVREWRRTVGRGNSKAIVLHTQSGSKKRTHTGSSGASTGGTGKKRTSLGKSTKATTSGKSSPVPQLAGKKRKAGTPASSNLSKFKGTTTSKGKGASSTTANAPTKKRKLNNNTRRSELQFQPSYLSSSTSSRAAKAPSGRTTFNSISAGLILDDMIPSSDSDSNGSSGSSSLPSSPEFGTRIIRGVSPAVSTTAAASQGRSAGSSTTGGSSSKQHQCDVCKKGFASPATLRKHQLVHGNKQYRCSVCGMEYFRKDNCYVHIRKVHPKAKRAVVEKLGNKDEDEEHADVREDSRREQGHKHEDKHERAQGQRQQRDGERHEVLSRGKGHEEKNGRRGGQKGQELQQEAQQSRHPSAQAPERRKSHFSQQPATQAKAPPPTTASKRESQRAPPPAQRPRVPTSTKSSREPLRTGPSSMGKSSSTSKAASHADLGGERHHAQLHGFFKASALPRFSKKGDVNAASTSRNQSQQQTQPDKESSHQASSSSSISRRDNLGSSSKMSMQGATDWMRSKSDQVRSYSHPVIEGFADAASAPSYSGAEDHNLDYDVHSIDSYPEPRSPSGSPPPLPNHVKKDNRVENILSFSSGSRSPSDSSSLMANHMISTAEIIEEEEIVEHEGEVEVVVQGTAPSPLLGASVGEIHHNKRRRSAGGSSGEKRNGVGVGARSSTAANHEWNSKVIDEEASSGDESEMDFEDQPLAKRMKMRTVKNTDRLVQRGGDKATTDGGQTQKKLYQKGGLVGSEATSAAARSVDYGGSCSDMDISSGSDEEDGVNVVKRPFTMPARHCGDGLGIKNVDLSASHQQEKRLDKCTMDEQPCPPGMEGTQPLIAALLSPPRSLRTETLPASTSSGVSAHPTSETTTRSKTPPQERPLSPILISSSPVKVKEEYSADEDVYIISSTTLGTSAKTARDLEQSSTRSSPVRSENRKDVVDEEGRTNLATTSTSTTTVFGVDLQLDDDAQPETSDLLSSSQPGKSPISPLKSILGTERGASGRSSKTQPAESATAILERLFGPARTSRTRVSASRGGTSSPKQVPVLDSIQGAKTSTEMLKNIFASRTAASEKGADKRESSSSLSSILGGFLRKRTQSPTVGTGTSTSSKVESQIDNLLASFGVDSEHTTLPQETGMEGVEPPRQNESEQLDEEALGFDADIRDERQHENASLLSPDETTTYSEHQSGMTEEDHHQLLELHEKLTQHRDAWPFRAPVDPIRDQAPDYYEVIDRPMDLYTISCKLGSSVAECVYAQEEDLDAAADRDTGAAVTDDGELVALEGRGGDGVAGYFADVRLMFENCFKYNGPMNQIHIYGKQLERFFISICRDVGLDTYVEDWNMEDKDYAGPVQGDDGDAFDDADYGDGFGDGEELPEHETKDYAMAGGELDGGNEHEEEDHPTDDAYSGKYGGESDFENQDRSEYVTADTSRTSIVEKPIESADLETRVSSGSSSGSSPTSVPLARRSMPFSRLHTVRAQQAADHPSSKTGSYHPNGGVADISSKSATSEMQESSKSSETTASRKGKEKPYDFSRPPPATSAASQSSASSSVLPIIKTEPLDEPMPAPLPPSQANGIAAHASSSASSASHDVNASTSRTLHVEWIGPPSIAPASEPTTVLTDTHLIRSCRVTVVGFHCDKTKATPVIVMWKDNCPFLSFLEKTSPLRVVKLFKKEEMQHFDWMEKNDTWYGPTAATNVSMSESMRDFEMTRRPFTVLFKNVKKSAKIGDGGGSGSGSGSGVNPGSSLKSLAASAAFWNAQNPGQEPISKFQPAKFKEFSALLHGQVALVRGNGVEGIVHATKKGSIFMVAVRRSFDDPNDKGILPFLPFSMKEGLKIEDD